MEFEILIFFSWVLNELLMNSRSLFGVHFGIQGNSRDVGGVQRGFANLTWPPDICKVHLAPIEFIWIQMNLNKPQTSAISSQLRSIPSVKLASGATKIEISTEPQINKINFKQCDKIGTETS